ncbi:MAG: Fic family protein [Myxococcota bacterium]
MPKVLPQRELESIAGLVAEHLGGLSLNELHAVLGAEVPRRTLQRRIAALVASGRVVVDGRGRATRYHVSAPQAGPASEADAPTFDPTPREHDIEPASAEARDLRVLVRRPLSQRTPIGYRRAFLDAYEPNVTSWLPEASREHLRAVGRAGPAGRPAGTYARDILGRLLIDLSWASSKLEGNTYTRLDTQNLIEQGQLAPGKDQRDAQMILNHKAAIEMLVDNAASIAIDRHTFQNLHALLSENLLFDPTASGRLRVLPVEISGSVFIPLAVPQQLEECFDLLLAKAQAIRDPFEQALFVMVQLPYLQPFLDGNKRVSRLGANIPFIRDNLSPLSFVDVPERSYIDGLLAVYELGRVELLRDTFIWAYERSALRYAAVTESLPDPDPLRMRHREALIELVGDVVRAGASIDLADLRTRAASLVPPDDVDQLAAMAFSDLHHLHQGNVARYRLRLSELVRWQSAREVRSV